MTPERYQQLESLVVAAIDCTTVERPKLLERLCGNDAQLRADVEELVRASDRAEKKKFLESGIPFPAQRFLAMPSPAEEPQAGCRFGAYELKERIGGDGMGIVWRAQRKEGYDQDVALKFIRAEMADPSLIERFHIERQVLANLDHPHIARLLDGGTTPEGLPYLVMELIDGKALDRHCDRKEKPASIAERARLMQSISAAIEYAHSRKVIHRDLKPSNVLVTADGTPKVIDFGLAKHLDNVSGPTVPGQVLGTPSFMAPEQVAGEPHLVGPHTDVYGLGAVLYHLVTGRPPFKGATLLETLEQVQTQDPPAPRYLQPNLPRDLETICLHCLEKDPRRRYSSAGALADDLRRFLDGEPILARPTPLWERVRKWMKRRPTTAALLAVSLFALLGLLGGGWYHVRQIDAANAELTQLANDLAKERDHAQEQTRLATDMAERAKKSQQEAEQEQQKALEGLAIASRSLRTLCEQASKGTPSQETIQLLKNIIAFLMLLELKYPTNLVYTEELGITFNNLGALHHKRKEYAAAEQNLLAACNQYQRLRDARPQYASYQQQLATILENLAQVQVEWGRFDKAAKTYETMVKNAEELLQSKPDNASYRRDLAQWYFKLGRFWDDRNGQDGQEASYLQARNAYQKAITEYENLVEGHPHKADYRKDLARTRIFLSDLYGATDHKEEAIQAIDQAIALGRGLVEQSASNRTYQAELGAAYTVKARLLHFKYGQPEESVVFSDLAVPLLEAVVAAQPANDELRDFLVKAYSIRGNANEELKQYAKALEAWDRVAALDPKGHRHHLHRAWCLAKLGDHVRAVEAAGEVARGLGTPPHQLVNLALVYAVCAGAARDDPRASSQQTEKYAAQAMNLLWRAQKMAHFKQSDALEFLRTDADLNALRDRKEFQELLRAVEPMKK